MAQPLPLHEIPTDALREVYKYVDLPYVLKLVCRALRAAGPARTVTTKPLCAKSKENLRVAHALFFPFLWDEHMACLIAENGNLEALKWANNVIRVPMNTNVAYGAATSGNLEMLRWMHSESVCELDGRSVGPGAAGHGHFHIVRWLHAHDMKTCVRTLNATAEWGNLQEVAWLVEQDPSHARACCLDYPARGSGRPIASYSEYKKIIKFLVSRGARFKRDDFCNSVRQASVRLLKWWRRIGVVDDFPHLTMMYAAEANRRDVIEWLVDECGYQFGIRMTYAAARMGHIELLAWLRLRNCPWDHTVPQAASFRKNVPLLRWLAANGAPIFHQDVRLDFLRRALLATPTGPLIDQMVPDAMWVHTLMRWRKVKLWVLKCQIARYWAQLERG